MACAALDLLAALASREPSWAVAALPYIGSVMKRLKKSATGKALPSWARAPLSSFGALLDTVVAAKGFAPPSGVDDRQRYKDVQQLMEEMKSSEGCCRRSSIRGRLVSAKVVRENPLALNVDLKQGPLQTIVNVVIAAQKW